MWKSVGALEPGIFIFYLFKFLKPVHWRGSPLLIMAK